MLWRTLPVVAVLCGLLVLATGCRRPVMVPGPQPPAYVSTEQLGARFETVAFFWEYSEDESRLGRWHGELHWRLAGNESERARQMVERVTARLAELSGLTIAEAGPGDEVNVEIHVKRRRDLLDILEVNSEHQGFVYGSLCWGMANYDRKTGVWERVTIGVPTHLSDEELETCLWIEVTQSLGLPNDLAGLEPSVFSDAGYLIVGDLPWYDALMVEVLYDDRLAAGMTRQEAMPIVREIVEERRSNR